MKVENIEVIHKKTEDARWRYRCSNLPIFPFLFSQDNYGNTPMLLAAEAGHVAAIQALHSLGADNLKPDHSCTTPLAKA